MGKKSRILHRYVLLSFKGRFRQDCGLEKDDTSVTDADDDEITEIPSVPVLPKVRLRQVSLLLQFPLSQWRLLRR